MAVQPAYPATLEIDYPDRPLDRVSTLFRIFTVIPILIILGLLEGGSTGQTASGGSSGNYANSFAGVGIVFVPTLLMILFRQKYPRWWFDWNLAFSRFGNRVGAYLLLLRDEYPSTDEEQAVHLDIIYPNAREDLNRWMPLVKFWLLAIPHYVVLFFLIIAAFVVVIIAWFAILFTGRYPRSLFDFVVGVMRWGLRVSAYAFILVTDKYPPFRLSA
jgi:hypothetical protein